MSWNWSRRVQEGSGTTIIKNKVLLICEYLTMIIFDVEGSKLI